MSYPFGVSSQEGFFLCLKCFQLHFFWSPPFYMNIGIGKVWGEVKGEVCHKIFYMYPIPVHAYNLLHCWPHLYIEQRWFWSSAQFLPQLYFLRWCFFHVEQFKVSALPPFSSTLCSTSFITTIRPNWNPFLQISYVSRVPGKVCTCETSEKV